MSEEKKVVVVPPTIVGSTKMNFALDGIKNINVAEMEAALQKAGANFKPNYVVIKNAAGKELGAEEIGIDDTIDVVAVILSLVKAFIEGGITNYLAALVQLPEAIIGIGNVALEIEDLDEADVQQLIDFVIQNFPTLPTEFAQAIVHHAIQALFHIYSIIKVVVENSDEPNARINPTTFVQSKGLGTT